MKIVIARRMVEWDLLLSEHRLPLLQYEESLGKIWL